MAMLKKMKSNAGKEVIDSMITKYGKSLHRAGIHITASEGGNNVVNINNNEDNDDNNSITLIWIQLTSPWENENILNIHYYSL